MEAEASELARMRASSPLAAPATHSAAPAQTSCMPLPSSGCPGCGARLA
ncbi:MAG: hypothetical protein JOY82_08395 [Streptosporangiaceae bacterium]|nr:hypothetical protein [Streptosporangiaceae bacterium]MBV9854533.1 hypothetical protein [Streptosporangiaceae bacterium]